MKRLPSHWIWTTVVFSVIAIMGDLPLARSAFCPTGCDQGCKAHNRWCVGGKHLRYASAIVPPNGGGDWGAGGYCSQAPDGGNGIELDTIASSRWSKCQADCVGINPSTGTMPTDAEQEASGFVVYNTRCTGK